MERLVGELFAGLKTDNGLEFQWASTRIKPGLVHLSFTTGDHQRLLDFSWDGITVDSAMRRARSFRDERDLEAPDI